MFAPQTVLHNRYQIETLLVQSARGAIYRARDHQAQRLVALKHIVGSAALQHTFKLEAERLLHLEHPVLPRVWESFAGPDGHFLAMEYVPGEDLEALMMQRRAPFAPTELVKMAEQVLDALTYLHEQATPLIHRDIKPQNLKFTPSGEVRLLDVGLAKGSMAVHAMASPGGSPSATPYYAPLEQIQGTGTDPRSDIYALAATLYYLATGYMPLDALTRTAAHMQRQPDPNPPAHEVNQRIPPTLGAALSRGMALNRERRPASVREFRALLKQSVIAPSSDPSTFIGAALNPSWKSLASTLLDRTTRLWEGDGTTSIVLKGHTKSVSAIAWSSDGQSLATGSENGIVSLWESGGTRHALLTGHGKAITGLAWNPNGRFLASLSANQVRLWGRDGTAIAVLDEHTREVTSLAWNPNARLLATASLDQTVRLWKADGTPHATLSGAGRPIKVVAWSPDGRLLAAADEAIRFWDANGQLRATLEGHAYLIYALAWSPDGHLLASASTDQTVRLWRPDGSLRATLVGHGKPIHALAWRPDGQILASLSWDDKYVWLWKPDGNLYSRLEGHSSWVHALAWSPDGRTLATASADRTVYLWEPNGRPRLALKGHTAGIYALAWSPDGRTLASGSMDGSVRLWCGAPVSGHEESV
ncbi:MAG: protein kinase [Ardenticatenales bacterium]|nr:protein kinase [Ardenticatenales bacterium]